ncbi:PepSY-associated TM helix domain-containing protein [Pseudidiomarina insulisalsae]|uniref:PepSY domain-containing protein n=1 Tax=Pseudidiomarina insulisalsae TaxID=575789 RepID=A0A432YPK8_9GAMM|nr:PepSY-associated TM helix domain-containing protein [Pseudidiomarina insulisalsae]RUO63060.1 PepSY domain-containing protein [Pseudidiomarina insulisalsae]
MWRHGFGRVHKWLGLALSVWMVLVALTGTLLLYKTELLQLQYPQLRLTTLPTMAEAAAVFDRFDAGYAFLPRDDKPWTEVIDGDGTTHYFNAAGEHLLARTELGDWVSWMVEFHHHMLLHDLGKDIMGILGLLSLLLVIAGLIRWWPRHWSWRVLSVRFVRPGQRQFMATLWQLHRSSGVIFIIPIAALLITGTAIMYAAFVNQSLERLLPQTSAISSAPMPTTPAYNWQQRLSLAKDYWPQQSPRLIYLAPTAEGNYRMRLRHEGEWHPNGRSYLVFADNGPMVSSDDVRARALGFRLSQTIYPLHVAAVGGWAWLTATLLGGLALILLPVTGVWFWWRRRRR